MVGSTTPAEWTFVGRDRELAELTAGVRDHAADRGALFCVTGEPGIGKTALAIELARHAHRQGARVVWGRCWEGGGAPPYWPWAQVLRSLVDTPDGEKLLHRVTGKDLGLAAAVPELDRADLSAAPEDPREESESSRFRVFEAVATFLSVVASQQPLVVIIDDLHAADVSSLLLLRFLARDVRTNRLLIVTAHRDVDVEQSPETTRVLNDLVGDARVISLRGLHLEDVGRLVSQHAAAPPAEKVAAIHDMTSGNPLFVREVTRLVAARNLLDQQGELQVTIPESVRAVIRRRLTKLSGTTAGVLATAAVVGCDFDLALVASACDLPAEQVLAALSEAVDLGVVAEESRVGGTYRFAHPLMREVIYDRLPIPVRAQLHQRVGGAIEQLHDGDLDGHLHTLAHHFGQAAGTSHGAKAQAYAQRAGDHAMVSGAYEDAAAEYERSLAALVGEEANDALRCELLVRYGKAQMRASRYPAAREACLRAAEIARKLNDAERFGLAALGFGGHQVEGGLVDRQLVALLREALRMLSATDHPLRAHLLARLSLELAFAPETEEQDSSSRAAVEVARRLGDVGGLSSALQARWMTTWGPEGLDERLALEQELLQLAAKADVPQLELVARGLRATSCLQAGDIRTVEAEIATYARVAGETRMPFHRWTAATMQAMQALLRGALDEAERVADEALALDPDRPNARFAHLDAITLIRWEQDRIAELRDVCGRTVDQFPMFAAFRGWLCLADAESDGPDVAADGLRGLVEQVEGLPHDGLWLAAAAIASLATAHLDDADAAADLYRLLRPHADHVIVMPTPHPSACFGSATLYLGLLAATLSLEEAEEHFETALDRNTHLGAHAFLARTEYEYARMLMRRSRSADRERARRLLDHAADSAAAMGLVQVGRGIERLRAGERRAATASPAARDEGGRGEGSPAYVFRREGEYWTIAYGGSTVRLRDTKGLRYLARLLANPGQELHAVDLVAAERGAAAQRREPAGRQRAATELSVRPDLGDAGALLDAKAKAAYKARMQDLQAELDEAERFNDPTRAAAAREELDFLTSELARAVGLGGRDRKAASHAERARLNATRAIRTAMRNLARAHPALGRHLTATIRTGQYCSYTPDPLTPISWRS